MDLFTILIYIVYNLFINYNLIYKGELMRLNYEDLKNEIVSSLENNRN